MGSRVHGNGIMVIMGLFRVDKFECHVQEVIDMSLSRMIRLAIVLSFMLMIAGSHMALAASGSDKSDQGRFNDPFAYCAAVGNIDAPDERYTGAELPDAIVKGLIKLEVVSADAPAQFQNNAAWRCMDGKVMACHYGANLPCMAKADLSREPSAEMTEFCKSNPGSDFIPAAVTGRATVYEWRCDGKKPEVIKEIAEPDANGFLSNIWYQINP